MTDRKVFRCQYVSGVTRLRRLQIGTILFTDTNANSSGPCGSLRYTLCESYTGAKTPKESDRCAMSAAAETSSSKRLSCHEPACLEQVGPPVARSSSKGNCCGQEYSPSMPPARDEVLAFVSSVEAL